MTDYSTCRRCKRLLQVTDGETVHPQCRPIVTKLEALQDNYRGLLAIADHVENEAALDPELVVLRDEIETLQSKPADMRRAALYVAGELGWPVFPLRPGTKTPATKHGFKDAHAELDRIERYWRANPEANIGVPTGIAFDVIDVDAPKREGQPDGREAFEWLRANRPAIDSHARVSTANGGLHLYVEPTGKDCTTNYAPSIDYRGIGGYVVIPPSSTPAGRWVWQNVPSPRIRKAAP